MNFTEEQREHVRYLERERDKRNRLDNPRLFKITKLLKEARKRSNKKGIAFLITLNDLPEWETILYCPVFPWIELSWDNNNQNRNSVSIDRIDNSMGYIPGNVRLISWKANHAKADSSDREIFALVEDIHRRSSGWRK